MSPGLAARVRCADGSQAFVKAVGNALNPDSPDIYRREAQIAASLPSTVAVPTLLGAASLDTVLFLINPALDGRDPEPFLVQSGVLRDVDSWHVTGLLAGIAAFFSEGCRQPDPPGLPTLRAFQQAQLDVVLAWLQRRTGWP